MPKSPKKPLARGKKSAGKATNSCCPLTGDALLRASADEVADSVRAAFPAGMSRPALCALATAGFTSLDQLRRTSVKELLGLHGMGPKGVDLLRTALRKQGHTLRP